MDVKNYNRNRKKPVRKKGLRIVAFLLLFIGVVLAVFRYYDVGVKTINKFNPIPYSTLKNSYFVVYRRGLGNI